MKLLSVFICALFFVSLQANAKGKGAGVHRMGLGVASPSYLGDYSPTGVRFNSGPGLSISYAPVGTTTTTGLHGHYAADYFGIRGSFYNIEPSIPAADTTDFAVAGGTTSFTLGISDDKDYGMLFSFGQGFRLGVTGNTDNKINTVGIAFDLSSITFDFDYGIDGDVLDYSMMRLGLGFHGGIFFAGVVHAVAKTDILTADSTAFTIGVGEKSWIFSVDYTPVDGSDDLSRAKFTMNF